MATALVDAQIPEKAMGLPPKGADNSFDNILLSPSLTQSVESFLYHVQGQNIL